MAPANNVPKMLNTARNWLTYLVDESQEQTEAIRQFHAACLPSCGRRFGITKRGIFCLVPRNTIPGDTIAIPEGSKVPFVLRKTDVSNGMYENVGECFVHGAMRGESFSWEGISYKEVTLC